MKPSNEEQLLLLSVSLQPLATNKEVINELLPTITDWQSLTNKMLKSGIAPLVYANWVGLPNASSIPATVKNTIENNYNIVLIRSLRLIGIFNQIATACTQQNIDIIPLKGIYLSDTLYADAGKRLMSDIDLLVKPEQAQAMLALLRSMGFSSPEEDSEFDAASLEVIHYPPMVKEGVAVEVHIKLHSDITSYAMSPLTIWEHAQKATVHGSEVQVMDWYDTLIFCCLHLYRHFNDGFIKFTSYSDIVNLIEKRPENFSWGVFKYRCTEYKCTTEVFKHILLAYRFMDVQLPQHLVNEYGEALKGQDVKLFFKYLHGYKGFSTGLPRHAGNLKYLNNPYKRMRYIMSIIFPPQHFIRSKFKLDTHQNTTLYYPYRWWLGVKGLGKVIRLRR